VISYAPHHVEQDIPKRPVRRRMGAPRTPPTGPEAARTAEAPQPTRRPRRRLLRPKERLPMAHAPARFPALEDVFHYFRAWRIDGTWERLHRAIRRRLREHLGRDPEPSAGIVDSQSTKTTGVGGEQRGFDGGKKVRGRKRHLLVDTEGLVLEARVHSAKVPDQDGIKRLLEPARSRLPRLSFAPVVGGRRLPGQGQGVGGAGTRSGG
jgi:transposase